MGVRCLTSGHAVIAEWQDLVMTDDRVMARARGLWEQLAAVPLSFPSSGGIAIAASPGSRLCPPSWAGIVQLGDAAIVTAPGEAQAGLLRQALEQVPVPSLVCSSELRARVAVTDVLGPAALAYLSRDDFRPGLDGARITSLPRSMGTSVGWWSQWGRTMRARAVSRRSTLRCSSCVTARRSWPRRGTSCGRPRLRTCVC